MQTNVETKEQLVQRIVRSLESATREAVDILDKSGSLENGRIENVLESGELVLKTQDFLSDRILECVSVPRQVEEFDRLKVFELPSTDGLGTFADLTKESLVIENERNPVLAKFPELGGRGEATDEIILEAYEPRDKSWEGGGKGISRFCQLVSFKKRRLTKSQIVTFVKENYSWILSRFHGSNPSTGLLFFFQEGEETGEFMINNACHKYYSPEAKPILGLNFRDNHGLWYGGCRPCLVVPKLFMV